MYEYLQGTLIQITAEIAVIDIQGIGYKILIPRSDASLEEGKAVRLWIEFVVREDAHALYGFTKREYRDFFRLLQHVNGIGPKLALNILSHTPAPDIAHAIFHKDQKRLISLPGVGKKMAEKIIIELHERVESALPANTPKHSLLLDGIRALQTLGFSASEARAAILKTQEKFPEIDSVETLVQQTLSR